MDDNALQEATKIMTGTMPLHFMARRVLGLNQRQTGELLGHSTRTIQRWDSGRSTPYFDDHIALAKAIFPKDQALAARLATAGGSSLAALGLVASSAPVGVGATPRTGPTIEHLLDSVVCAAAIAMNAKPLDVRPALAAAFTRVRQLGLSLEEAERGLVGEDAKRAKEKK